MAFFLSCNNLTSATCSVGNYVIDWRLGSVTGNIKFITANSGNLEPGVDAYHPIVNEVLPAGTYYPVIRYVYVGADKITSAYEVGALYSPDLLTCLSPVVIDPITCTSTNFTPTDSLPYDFRIIRDVGQGSKDRIFTFQIGVSTQYFAWAMNADNVSDQILIYYCTLAVPEGTLIDNLVTGTDATTNITPVSYPINPIILDNQINNTVIKYVSDLTSFTYTVGNFIRVEILGNYYNPSLDATKWTIYMRCLTSLGAFPNMSPTFTKTGPVVVEYDITNCRYEFRYPVTTPLNDHVAYSGSDLAKYFYMQQLGNGLTNTSILQPAYDGNINFHNWSETAIGSSGGANFGCALWAGTVTASKTSNVVTWNFTSPTDYAAFKTRYDQIIAIPSIVTGLSAAPTTETLYYSNFRIWIMQDTGGCDTSMTSFDMYISIHSTWTFDPTNQQTISVQLFQPTNQLIEYGVCNSWNETVTGYVSEMTNDYNLANFSYPSIKRYDAIANHFGANYPVKTYPNSIDSNNIFSTYIPNVMLNNIYTPTNALGWVSNYSANQWYSFIGYDTSEFTLFSNNTERLNNWTYKRSRYFTTLNQSDLFTNDIVDYSPSTTTTTTTV